MRFEISLFLYSAASSFLSTFRIFPLSGRMAWNCRSLACFALPPVHTKEIVTALEKCSYVAWVQIEDQPGLQLPMLPQNIRDLALVMVSSASDLYR